MKTCEIRYEPIIINGVEYPKYNVYYFGGLFDDQNGTKEFHSIDGKNGTIKDGYKNIGAPDWLGLEQELVYSSLRAKAKQYALPNNYSEIAPTLNNGKRGEASEAFLKHVLQSMFNGTNPEVSWTEQEKQQLNQFLVNNKFKITIE